MSDKVYYGTPFYMVGEFHRIFGHPTNLSLDSNFCETNQDAMKFRYNLNEEELDELMTAYEKLYKYIDKFKKFPNETNANKSDLSTATTLIKKMINTEYSEFIDACGDLTYVLNGQLHYIGFNPDICDIDGFLNCWISSQIIGGRQRKFNIFNDQTRTYVEILIHELELCLDNMKTHLTNTKTVIMIICHMLNIINTIVNTIGFNIVDIVTIVHNSNMTKLCYSEDEAKDTVQKYNKLYEESNDEKYKYPTYKVVDDDKKIFMVSNLDPSKGPECAKVLKSINFKTPDFSELIDKTIVYN